MRTVSVEGMRLLVLLATMLLGCSNVNIFKEAASGNLKAVEQYLQEHPHRIDSVDPGGNTLLLSAARAGRVEIVRFLVDAGANVHLKNILGMDALYISLVKDHLAVARLLLENDANPNTKDNSGASAFLLAVLAGDMETVSLMIERGADVDARYKGNTALHVAVRQERPDIVAILLGAGADSSTKNSDQVLPIEIAKMTGNEEIVALLESQGNPAKDRHE